MNTYNLVYRKQQRGARFSVQRRVHSTVFEFARSFLLRCHLGQDGILQAVGNRRSSHLSQALRDHDQ